jgi:hypothetical protein
MKHLITFLLLIPTLCFAQTSGWRNNSNNNGSGFHTNPPSNNNSGTSTWRTTPPKPSYNYTPTTPSPRYYGTYPTPYNYYPHHHYDSWYGSNNWDYWGAPYGYHSWAPGYYYDNWGYRQPYRIYTLESGTVDTVRGETTHFSVGIQMSTDKQLGGWLTIGNRGYFIIEYNQTYERDNSMFYPSGTLAQVDFPLVEDLKKLYTFYIGVGKKFGRTGIHFMLGNAYEDVRYRGKDNVGYITFPKYTNNFITTKIGVVHDFKGITLKLDGDPILKSVYFGAGLNF